MYCNKEVDLHESRYKNIIKNNRNFFCSKECKQSWESINYKGKNNPHYLGGNITKYCLCCNKKFEVRRYRKDSAKYCSRQCKDKYLKDVISKSQEFIELHRKVGINCMKNQTNKETKPERLVKDYLLKNNISFLFQYPMYDKFVVDFYLPYEDIIIEVQGDYWHGNPSKYKTNSLTEKQYKNKQKDIIKYNYLTESNHSVFMVWENDIYKNIDCALFFI